MTAALWPPLGTAAAAYAAAFTLAAAWAFLVEPSWVAIETSRVETTGPLLDRRVLKILHVTDLHLEEFGGPEERLLAVAKREQPDLVLLTGDYVNSREAISVLVRLLRGLSAPLGVFGVEGHHDHKYRIAEAFEEGGATLLRDEFVLLSGGGRPVAVVGLAMHPARPRSCGLRRRTRSASSSITRRTWPAFSSRARRTCSCAGTRTAGRSACRGWAAAPSVAIPGRLRRRRDAPRRDRRDRQPRDGDERGTASKS